MGKSYQFGTVDYVVFSSMLLISAGTGLYYGCRYRYRKSTAQPDLREYLSGSKNLKPFPVAMSLVGSYISGVTMLGTPTEIYNFGSQYWLITFAIIISGTAVSYVFLPVFFLLQVQSSYEYLEMRFNRKFRLFASILFVLDEAMFLPIVVYVPSLAFNQVTGVSVHIVGTIVSVICIFYTVLGGMRAVVYTDAWQIIVMFASVIVIVILGTSYIGGFGEVWNRSERGKRIIFNNFNTSLFERNSFFSVLIGGAFYWTAFNSVNQTMVQRYLSLSTIKESKTSVFIFTAGVCTFVSLCVYSGLLVYATYHTCDPLTAGRIERDDQLLPLYVIETVGHLQGIPGLFIAGVFGAALSSLSVILNSTSAVILQDFLRGCFKLELQEQNSTISVKVIVLVLGIIAIAFSFVVEYMGGILAAATSLSAISASTTFGMFCLGMLNPWCTSFGGLIGSIAGAIAASTIAFGRQYALATGHIIPHKLPVNISGCLDQYDITVNATEIIYPDESHVFSIFRISYHWITPIGIIITVLIGTIASIITGVSDISCLDPELISPVAQWMLPPESQQYLGTASKKIRERNNDESTGLMHVSNNNLRNPTVAVAR